MQKLWDNPTANSMPAGEHAATRVPASYDHRQCAHCAGDRARPHGRRYRYGFSPLHQECQQVHPGVRLYRCRPGYLKRAVRLRPHHDRVHLRRRAEPHARNQAQALPDLLRGRAPHLRPALRLKPGNARRLRPDLPGRRLRPRRSEPRLPSQARRRLQRRVGSAARSPADRSHLQARPRRRVDSLHRQISYGLERQQHRLCRARQAGRRLRPERRRPTRAHTAKTATPARRAGSTSLPSRMPSPSPSSAMATSSHPKTPSP